MDLYQSLSPTPVSGVHIVKTLSRMYTGSGISVAPLNALTAMFLCRYDQARMLSSDLVYSFRTVRVQGRLKGSKTERWVGPRAWCLNTVARR